MGGRLLEADHVASIVGHARATVFETVYAAEEVLLGAILLIWEENAAKSGSLLNVDPETLTRPGTSQYDLVDSLKRLNMP